MSLEGESRRRTGALLARTAALLPAVMAAWWFAGKSPSLWVLEKLAYLPLALLVAPGGGLAPVQVDPLTHDWTFNVGVSTYGRNAQTGETVFINSIEFTTDEDSVAFFASGWFAYLALAVAAGAVTRTQLPRVAKGLAIITAVNVLSLAAYAYINGYGSVINSPGKVTGYLWLLKYIYHLIYLVVPFAGPFAVAMLEHSRWRECFGASVQPAYGEIGPRRKERGRGRRSDRETAQEKAGLQEQTR